MGEKGHDYHIHAAANSPGIVILRIQGHVILLTAEEALRLGLEICHVANKAEDLRQSEE